MDRQAAARQQRQRERELDDDERLPQAVTSAGEGAAALLQRVVGLRASRLPGGRASEEDARERAGREREREHRQVEPHVGLGRQRAVRHQEQDAFQDGRRERDAERPSDRRQHEALDEQLPHDLPARRAERRAQRELALTGGAARQQQVRDVGAGDEQHESDGAEQQPQRRLRRVAEEVVLERLDAGAPARVGFRKRLREVGRDGQHVRVGLLKSDAGLQPAHDEQPVKVVVHLLGLERQRQIQLALVLVGRPGRQDADDRVRLAVDANLAPDHVGIAAEALVPEAVGQHRHVVATDDAFFGPEVTTGGQPVADHREEPRGHGARLHLLRMIRGREVRGPAAERVQVLKYGRLPLPLEERARGADVPVVLDARPDHDELIRLGIRQRREQRRVDHAEDGGVGGDAQREGQHGDGGEAGVPAQHPHAVSRISQHVHGASRALGALDEQAPYRR